MRHELLSASIKVYGTRYSRSILVLACLLSLIGLSGCEQAEGAKKAITETAEEAKKAAGELMTESVDKAQQVIGEVTSNTGESEDEGKKEKEDTESAEEKANEEGG